MDHLEISLTCKKFTTFCPHLLFENPENLELHSPSEPRRFMGRFACLGIRIPGLCGRDCGWDEFGMRWKNPSLLGARVTSRWLLAVFFFAVVHWLRRWEFRQFCSWCFFHKFPKNAQGFPRILQWNKWVVSAWFQEGLFTVLATVDAPDFTYSDSNLDLFWRWKGVVFGFLTSSDLSFFLKWLLVVKSRCTPLEI